MIQQRDNSTINLIDINRSKKKNIIYLRMFINFENEISCLEWWNKMANNINHKKQQQK
jgi:hypothetical protein